MIGCQRTIRSSGAILCNGHYTQQYRGRPFTELPPPVTGDVCAVDGCEKPRRGRMCRMHAARVERHGDPMVVIAPGVRATRKGPDNPRWTEVPSYDAVHHRLRRERGKASASTCACGEPAAQWSYQGPREPGERLPYSANLEDYVAMCVPCHKRADLDTIT